MEERPYVGMYTDVLKSAFSYSTLIYNDNILFLSAALSYTGMLD